MTALEHISLFQRLADSIKKDISGGNTLQALGKLDVMEGELVIMRSEFSKTEENNIVETIE